MMKHAWLLCALCVCAPLSLQVRAAERPARTAESAATANQGEAVGGARIGRPVVPESSRTGSATGRSSKGLRAAAAASPREGSMTPPHAGGLRARGTAGRLHPLLPANTHGSLASQANRRVALNSAAATGAVSVRGGGLQGASRAAPALPAITGADRLRGSSIGGPRTAGPGRLGGAAAGRTANTAGIDGARVHRKF
jgi:hypothetical protein